jgi:hypothetical protein
MDTGECVLALATSGCYPLSVESLAARDLRQQETTSTSENVPSVSESGSTATSRTPEVCAVVRRLTLHGDMTLPED